MDYKTFMKHAKKVTKNAPEHKPVLCGVKHFEDGSAVVTDSFRLYLVKGIHGRNDGAVLSPDGKKIGGKYPETGRLIPDPLDAKQKTDVDVAEFLTAFDIMQSVAQSVSLGPGVMIRRNGVHFYSEEVEASYELSVEFEEVFATNSVFWVDALKLFKAFKYETATFSFYGKYRPFTLVSKDEKITVLILPIRIH